MSPVSDRGSDPCIVLCCAFASDPILAPPPGALQHVLSCVCRSLSFFQTCVWGCLPLSIRGCPLVYAPPCVSPSLAHGLLLQVLMRPAPPSVGPRSPRPHLWSRTLQLVTSSLLLATAHTFSLPSHSFQPEVGNPSAHACAGHRGCRLYRQDLLPQGDEMRERPAGVRTGPGGAGAGGGGGMCHLSLGCGHRCLARVPPAASGPLLPAHGGFRVLA